MFKFCRPLLLLAWHCCGHLTGSHSVQKRDMLAQNNFVILVTLERSKLVFTFEFAPQPCFPELSFTKRYDKTLRNLFLPLFVFSGQSMSVIRPKNEQFCDVYFIWIFGSTNRNQVIMLAEALRIINKPFIPGLCRGHCIAFCQNESSHNLAIQKRR